MSEFFRFYGGVHPKQEKLASKVAIASAPLLERYTVPLQMHIGAPAKLVVQKDSKVLRGQLLAEAGGFVSARIHSPTSGIIKEVTTCLGVTGTQWPAVIIESDGEDAPADPLTPIPDWQEADPTVLLKRIGEAGIVGMGGASFPTQVKLSPPPDKPIDTLVINGVECEPCLTADHRLMLENPEQIIKGILIVARILGVKNIFLGIEKNKPDAVELMSEKAKGTPIQVCPLEVRYPQGAEKQLIYALTKRKVPSGGLPMAIGCVVQNIASACAIADAVIDGTPLYERVTTVTGTPLIAPGNWHFRVGTLYEDAVRLAGGVNEDPAKIISGGPMMGLSVYSLQIPITKNCSGILLLSPSEVNQYQSKSCIRCGRCNDTCPMQLMPGILSIQIENERFELAETWHVLDCMECGCCSYVCPAGRPLVQHMRRAKTEVIARRQATAAAVKKNS
ncbi:MAG: electron transport complex subunit RsxC [Lentisphaeria bacterium]